MVLVFFYKTDEILTPSTQTWTLRHFRARKKIPYFPHFKLPTEHIKNNQKLKKEP